jgi:hypothetical protein
MHAVEYRKDDVLGHAWLSREWRMPRRWVKGVWVGKEHAAVVGSRKRLEARAEKRVQVLTCVVVRLLQWRGRTDVRGQSTRTLRPREKEANVGECEAPSSRFL